MKNNNNENHRNHNGGKFIYNIKEYLLSVCVCLYTEAVDDKLKGEEGRERGLFTRPHTHTHKPKKCPQMSALCISVCVCVCAIPINEISQP